MRTRYIVAYDIRDPKRLRKTHDVVQSFGYGLQYSVFICDLTKSEKIMMRTQLGDVINSREDSVVFVDLGPARARGTECFEFMGARDPLPRDGESTIV